PREPAGSAEGTRAEPGSKRPPLRRRPPAPTQRPAGEPTQPLSASSMGLGAFLSQYVRYASPIVPDMSCRCNTRMHVHLVHEQMNVHRPCALRLRQGLRHVPLQAPHERALHANLDARSFDACTCHTRCAPTACSAGHRRPEFLSSSSPPSVHWKEHE